MTALAAILVILAAVALAVAVARVVPVVPLPLVQIAVGFALGAGTDLHVRLDPELFFVLFLPPLLFLDGFRLPKDEVRQDLDWVAGLVTALVLCTVLGVGWLAHALLPAMPLAVAFALAAVLSPTDPIALSAIAARVTVPHRMMRILEAEALLNDASGLVCLRFAIVAATTGAFSLAAALGTFLWVALAGLAVGVAVVLATLKLGDVVARRFGADPDWHILVSLLLPFAAYLLAERLHASGILASVGAGVAMTFAARNPTIGAATRVQGDAVWDFVQLALNGAIFVLLGEQLPHILGGAERMAGDGGDARIAIATVIIYLALLALRFGWTWAAFALARARGTASPLMLAARTRLTAAFALAGVRGAVTLAGVLTLPLALADGSAFPARDLAIFVAAAVILLSIVTASVGLPLLLRGIALPADEAADVEERAARASILRAAVAALEARAAPGAAADVTAQAAAQGLAASLAAQIGGDDEVPADRRRRLTVEAEMHRVALRAGHDEAMRLVATGTARSAIVRRIVRELDLTELRL